MGEERLDSNVVKKRALCRCRIDLPDARCMDTATQEDMLCDYCRDVCAARIREGAQQG